MPEHVATDLVADGWWFVEGMAIYHLVIYGAIN